MATNATFITQLYTNVLGRAPTSNELNTQVGRIEIGGVSQTTIASEFITSAQGQSDQAIIRLYIAAFNRYPDLPGLQVQENAIANGTQTLTTLATNFANSAEFIARYPSTTDATTLLTAYYTNVLGRAPDAAGLAVQVAAYNAFPGTTAQKNAQFLNNFAQSNEFTTTRSGEVQAVLAYVAVDNSIPSVAQAQAASAVPLATYIPLLNDGTNGNGIAAGTIVNGVTLALTTGTDVVSPSVVTAATKTSSLNDVILASDTTLTAGDSIDGGDGIDTLRATFAASKNVAFTGTSLEIIDASVADTFTFTLAADKIGGLQQLIAKDAGQITATGVSTNTIIQLNGAVVNSKQYITHAAGVTAATVQAFGGTATDLKFDGANINKVDITTGTATTTLAALTAATAATVTVGGDKNLTVNSSDLAATVAVNASALTGNLTFFAENAAKLTFTGGSGSDRLVLAAVADLDGDSINFGAGAADVLDITGLAALDSTGITSARLAVIQGATGIDVLGGGTTATTKIDAGYFSSINSFRATLVNTANTDVIGLKSGSIVTVTNSKTFDTTKALTLDAAAASTTGATLALGGGITVQGNTGATDGAITTTTKFADLTINSTGTTGNSIIGGAGAGSEAIFNAGTFTLKVTGSANLTIANANFANMGYAAFNKSISVDASAFTGKLTIQGSADADSFIGSAQVDTFIFDKNNSTDQKLDTITNFKAGAGGDLIDTVTSGAGNYVALNAAQQTTITGQADLQAAATQASTFAATGKYTVFTFGGSTFFYDNANNAGYSAADDVLVRLTGVVATDFVAANVV